LPAPQPPTLGGKNVFFWTKAWFRNALVETPEIPWRTGKGLSGQSQESSLTIHTYAKTRLSAFFLPCKEISGGNYPVPWTPRSRLLQEKGQLCFVYSEGVTLMMGKVWVVRLEGPGTSASKDLRQGSPQRGN
jgi:hypothetical protein